MGLHYIFGTVSSRKSLELLTHMKSYNDTHMDTISFLIKPKIDNRDGKHKVWSRVNIERQADYVLDEKDDIPVQEMVNLMKDKHGAICCVDECQFLTPKQAIQLVKLSIHMEVYCFGLRTTFKGDMFDCIPTIMAHATTIRQLSSLCRYCGENATYNLRLNNGIPVLDGPTIHLGHEESYVPCCTTCFIQKSRFLDSIH
jgi:thymidine kinase